MIIRRFKEDDAKQVSRLIEASVKASDNSNYSDESKHEFLRLHTPSEIIEKSKVIQYFLAIDDDKKIIGIMGLGDNDEIRTSFVQPELFGKGVGKLLYLKIEKLAKDKGIRLLHLESSIGAMGFYEKMGFRTIRKQEITRRNVKSYVYYMEKELQK